MVLHYVSDPQLFFYMFLDANHENTPLDVFQVPYVLLQRLDNYWRLKEQRYWIPHPLGRYLHGFVATANFLGWVWGFFFIIFRGYHIEIQL